MQNHTIKEQTMKNKSIAQVKAETQLLNIKRVIPDIKFTKNQEDYLVSCFTLTYQEGELAGMKKSGSIFIK
jgi:hypothetical protein